MRCLNLLPWNKDNYCPNVACLKTAEIDQLNPDSEQRHKFLTVLNAVTDVVVARCNENYTLQQHSCQEFEKSSLIISRETEWQFCCYFQGISSCP